MTEPIQLGQTPPLNMTADMRPWLAEMKKVSEIVKRFQFGLARYFAPVCIRRPLGFIGGPSGYEEVPADEANRGPIILWISFRGQCQVGRGHSSPRPPGVREVDNMEAKR